MSELSDLSLDRRDVHFQARRNGRSKALRPKTRIFLSRGCSAAPASRDTASSGVRTSNVGAPPIALRTDLGTWTDDFDGLMKRWVIRILAPYSRTLFFEDRGDAHTGPVTNMTTEPAGLSAAIIAVQALAFLILAYAVTLLRSERASAMSPPGI